MYRGGILFYFISFHYRSNIWKNSGKGTSVLSVSWTRKTDVDWGWLACQKSVIGTERQALLFLHYPMCVFLLLYSLGEAIRLWLIKSFVWGSPNDLTCSDEWQRQGHLPWSRNTRDGGWYLDELNQGLGCDPHTIISLAFPTGTSANWLFFFFEDLWPLTYFGFCQWMSMTSVLASELTCDNPYLQSCRFS